MANYKISQLPAYDQPVATDDLLAAVDTSFGTTKKLTTAQLFTDAGLTGLTTADSIDFNAGVAGGELSWNNQDKTIDIETGSDGVVIQVGQEVVLRCRNTSGEILVDGDVVKITGATGGTPNISKAIASTIDEAQKTIGVCTQTIANNSTGFITELGKVRGLSFPVNDFDEGDLLYLSDTIAGGLTKTKPPIQVELGQVIRTGNSNGEFAVSINNEASVYELEQQMLILIDDNTAAIAAKIPNDSTTGTPSAYTFLRGDNAWASLAGGGDMLKSVYDPSNKDASAFSMGNMDETATAKILTATERSEIAANTSKVGITPTQAEDIVANNAKVGITPTQAEDIVANNAKVGITPTQAEDIVANTAKVGITPTQAEDIVANNAKVGITPTQASDINTALQPADPTLDLVTDNGATTTNNITVGSKFATGNNVASGTNCIAIGGTGNSAIGANCEVVGGGGSEASGTGSSVFGGSSHTNRGNWTATVGGLNHDVIDSAIRGAIIGGYDHHLNHSDSVIIGGNDITTDAASTVFVPSLNVGAGFKMPTGAADSYILTSSVTGAGTWQANAKVGNDTTGEVAGSDSVLNMVSLTQAQYDTALANFPATIKETTLYIIKP